MRTHGQLPRSAGPGQQDKHRKSQKLAQSGREQDLPDDWGIQAGPRELVADPGIAIERRPASGLPTVGRDHAQDAHEVEERLRPRSQDLEQGKLNNRE